MMNMFIQMIATAFLALTAQNVLMVGGLGISRTLRAANRPKLWIPYAGLVSFFTLISAVLTILLDLQLSSSKVLLFYRPVGYAVCAAIVYFVTVLLLRSIFPVFYKKLAQVLSPAAINCVVLSIPFISRILKFSPAQVIGFSLGTGLAFFLATVVLKEARKNFQNAEMPKAFCGLPATLIYMGILSMAFFGFANGRLF